MEKNVWFKTKSFSELNLYELYEILALRQKVFVVEQDCPYMDADNKDYKAKHLLGFVDNELKAYARLLPAGIQYPNEVSIGRVLTDVSCRKMGIGKALMEKAIEECQNYWQGKKITISAQAYLEDFYNKLGFVSSDNHYLEDGIPHMEMHFFVEAD